MALFFVPTKQLFQLLWLCGLNQVVVEACLQRTAPIFLLAPTRHGYQYLGLQLGAFVEPAGHGIAVHSRHADVQEHHLWMKRLDDKQGGGSIVGHTNLLPDHSQKHGHAIRRIYVIVHYQNPMTASSDHPWEHATPRNSSVVSESVTYNTGSPVRTSWRRSCRASVVLPEPGSPSTRYRRSGVRPPPRISSRPELPVATCGGADGTEAFTMMQSPSAGEPV